MTLDNQKSLAEGNFLITEIVADEWGPYLQEQITNVDNQFNGTRQEHCVFYAAVTVSYSMNPDKFNNFATKAMGLALALNW